MSTSPPPKRMTRAARRSALLDAAADLLRDDRAVLTFESIAERAGVSPTLPYKYFSSVDDVADELYQRIVRVVDDETDRIIADESRSFDDKVRAALSLWFDTIRRDGVLLLRVADGVAHPGLLQAIDDRRERAVDVWADHLMVEFALPHAEARLVAGVLTAGSTAVLRRWIRDGLHADSVLDLFVTMTRAQIAAVTPS